MPNWNPWHGCIKDCDGKKEINVSRQAKGRTLLSILREQGIYVDAPCGGLGKCGRCRVKFISEPPEATDKERELLTEAELKEGIRLACMVVLEEDCRIELESGNVAEIWTLTQGLSDAESEGVPEELEPEAGRKPDKSEVERESRKEPDKVAEGYGIAIDNAGQGYGIAIDIGTTTLALALIALESGKEVAVVTGTNHQRAYGADVLSRIDSANKGKLLELQKSIRYDLMTQIKALLRNTNVSLRQIRRVVIAGNTTMCHLLRGLSCESLGVAPFTPVDIGMWKGKFEQAEVVIFPGISTFVGADIVAGIYGLSLHRKKEPAMLLDIGTNGELVIGDENGFLVTSAAAGPVFEGGNISCGVPGTSGAISHVTLKPGGGAASCDTIENQTPVGLCGTGIIDVVSELVCHSLVDENGTLAEEWFETGVPVVGEQIRFTQKDVREVQMGKAAIRAGIETLLAEYESQKLPVYLAGGFGYDMDVDNAIRIGLFPESFRNTTQAAGNTVLFGLKKFLLAVEEDGNSAEAELLWIASHAREINLAMHTQFAELYMQYMFF